MKRTVVLACILVTTPLDAQGSTPMLVQVTGQGTVRVRFSDRRGSRTECDDHREHMFFDGSMVAGTAAWMQSPSACVCMQHTWGGFREIQWSLARTICPIDHRYIGGGYETFVRVDISTEVP